MSALDDRRRLTELYLSPADDFVLVDVPEMQFVMIDGDGDPGGEGFRPGLSMALLGDLSDETGCQGANGEELRRAAARRHVVG